MEDKWNDQRGCCTNRHLIEQEDAQNLRKRVMLLFSLGTLFPLFPPVYCCLWKSVRTFCNQKRPVGVWAVETTAWKPEAFGKQVQGEGEAQGWCWKLPWTGSHVLSLHNPGETKRKSLVTHLHSICYSIWAHLILRSYRVYLLVMLTMVPSGGIFSISPLNPPHSPIHPRLPALGFSPQIFPSSVCPPTRNYELLGRRGFPTTQPRLNLGRLPTELRF